VPGNFLQAKLAGQIAERDGQRQAEPRAAQFHLDGTLALARGGCNRGGAAVLDKAFAKLGTSIERAAQKCGESARPVDRTEALLPRVLVCHRVLFAVPTSKRTKLPPPAIVCLMMNLPRKQSTAAQLDMDRQIIRVDIPPAHAGITAALRRAFEAAASEPCDRDFDELLRRLN
jgi:hypothetical protein